MDSQAAADAKYYGNTDIYNVLRARGAKVPVPTNSTQLIYAMPLSMVLMCLYMFLHIFRKLGRHPWLLQIREKFPSMS